MRVPRIFQDKDLEIGNTIELDESAAKHLVQVLRFEQGREVIVFNGLGGEFRATLSSVSKRSASISVLEKIDIERESDINIHLAQCASKGDRFEFAIQKAVELGVKEITPIFSARSQLKLNHERKDKKLKHWKQIALNACEQSGRTQIVVFNEPIALPDFFEKNGSRINSQSFTNLILHPEAEQKFSDVQINDNYTLLIGPEGGFEEQELELAFRKGFLSVRLGKQILRTETAPIAAISALHILAKEF